MRPYALSFSLHISHHNPPLRFYRSPTSLSRNPSSSVSHLTSAVPTTPILSQAVVDDDDPVLDGIVTDDVSTSDKYPFATSYHAPVMAKECICALLQNAALDDSWKEDNALSANKKRKLKYAKMKQEKDALLMQQPEDVDHQLRSHSRNIHRQEHDRQRPLGSKHSEIHHPQRPSPRLFIDGTLGGGGHSHYLLQSLNQYDIVIGCDVDHDALRTASARLSSYMQGNSSLPLFIPVRSNFKDLVDNLSGITHPHTGETIVKFSIDVAGQKRTDTNNILFPHGADGLLLDLGVSSYQIDNPDRGFTYIRDGPLDMRMSSTLSLTASDICNEFSEEQLVDILRRYGDEPRARAIAQSIAKHRPLKTTMHLVDAIAEVTPSFSKNSRRMGRMATCARVFQSLRIVVNQEEDALSQVLLKVAPTIVRRGEGRLVVLTYHSLEDRAVKRAIRDGEVQSSPSIRENNRDMYGNVVHDEFKPWSLVGKKLKATEDEVEVNSRARSATLRVATRM